MDHWKKLLQTTAYFFFYVFSFSFFGYGYFGYVKSCEPVLAEV